MLIFAMMLVASVTGATPADEVRFGAYTVRLGGDSKLDVFVYESAFAPAVIAACRQQGLTSGWESKPLEPVRDGVFKLRISKGSKCRGEYVLTWQGGSMRAMTRSTSVKVEAQCAFGGEASSGPFDNLQGNSEGELNGFWIVFVRGANPVAAVLNVRGVAPGSAEFIRLSSDGGGAKEFHGAFSNGDPVTLRMGGKVVRWRDRTWGDWTPHPLNAVA